MTVDLPEPDGADDEDELALVDRERDAVESRDVRLVDLRHVLEHDHRGAARIGRDGHLQLEIGLRFGECRHRVVCLRVQLPSPGVGAHGSLERLLRLLGRRQCSRHLPSTRHLPGRLGEQVRVHEAVEPAVEDGLRVPDLEVGSVILHQLVRVQHVGADLTPEADVLRRAALARELGLALLLLELGET